MKVSQLGLAVIAIFGLGVLAWFAKPRTLKQRLEHEGVHFTPDLHRAVSINQFAYTIDKAELPTLLAGLKQEGFQVKNNSGRGAEGVYYEMWNPTKHGFLGSTDHLTILDEKTVQVCFDFRIE